MNTITSVLLFQSESLQVNYSDGSRLQLSPCGTEFVLEKGLPPSAHPLQRSAKVQQRTRFVTSSYKEMVRQCLDIRNRFANQPYLPEELIPPAHMKQSFLAITHAEWPSLSTLSSLDLEQGPHEELVIRSVDGNARLRLASSGEEFCVEFLCRISQKPVCEDLRSGTTPGSELGRAVLPGSHSNLTLSDNAKGDGVPEIHQSGVGGRFQYTWVVQHHSCANPPPFCRYPLSVAIGLWHLQRKDPAVTAKQEKTEEHKGHVENVSGEHRCHLPEALPLCCSSPHLHMWRFKDPHYGHLNELPSELLKLMWCNGVVYRVISTTEPIVEISPGDGSVIRSRNAGSDYFTHHCAKAANQITEKTYLLNNLPPDLPGQTYSVRSIVTHAARILKRWNEVQISNPFPQCCLKKISIDSECLVLIQDDCIPGLGHFRAFSDGGVRAHFFEGVTLQMRWNFLSHPQKADNLGDTQLPSGWCQMTWPDGHQQLIPLKKPGPYLGYVQTAEQWCQQVDLMLQQSETHATPSEHMWSVRDELEKIKIFNFLLDNSRLLGAPALSAKPTDFKKKIKEDRDVASEPAKINESSVAQTLQKTTNTIQDIEALLSKRAKN